MCYGKKYSRAKFSSKEHLTRIAGTRILCFMLECVKDFPGNVISKIWLQSAYEYILVTIYWTSLDIDNGNSENKH